MGYSLESFNRLHHRGYFLENLNLNEGGSTPIARMRYCEREHEFGAERLMNDYFVDKSTYTSEIFQRRSCMQKSLFLLVEVVIFTDEYFQQTHMSNVDMVFHP